MVLTESTMLPLGTPAPDFALPDPHGKTVSLADFDGAKALLVAFICNHCPYVIHLKPALAAFARDFQAKGLAVVAINANDYRSYPQDAPARMAEDVDTYGYTFAYLVDEDQSVAKTYKAACTPEFYLFDQDRRLVYRGRFDASTPGNREPVTGGDLRAAAEAVLAGREVPATQIPSMGCNIKWKTGNQPDYFA